MKSFNLIFTLLISFSLTAMEHDFGGEKQEEKTDTRENSFDELPNEIIEKIFSELSYQDQKTLLCVDQRFKKFKQNLSNMYTANFNNCL